MAPSPPAWLISEGSLDLLHDVFTLRLIYFVGDVFQRQVPETSQQAYEKLRRTHETFLRNVGCAQR